MVDLYNEKKQKTAVALGFEPGDEAPKIIATGKGHLADKIIEGAREANVPIHKDAKLAETLSKLDFGEYIPPELYEVVVEVLMYVDKVDAIKSKMK
ncbi:MAG: EscU/YscU/HrcU family type III secretion system export apparatus switch protein [Lachnospiraceae bacterium]|nr:EscU/YscU/HrcU family type III secretion system export apparatus switch protein [Lachnospiraceae bacterium]